MSKAPESERNQDKIGSGHAKAMFRQGLAELRGALYADSNVAQPTEYGVYGKETPSEVAASREGATSKDDERSVLDEALQSAKARGRDRSDGRDVERDRE